MMVSDVKEMLKLAKKTPIKIIVTFSASNTYYSNDTKHTRRSTLETTHTRYD